MIAWDYACADRHIQLTAKLMSGHVVIRYCKPPTMLLQNAYENGGSTVVEEIFLIEVGVVTPRFTCLILSSSSSSCPVLIFWLAPLASPNWLTPGLSRKCVKQVKTVLTNKNKILLFAQRCGILQSTPLGPHVLVCTSQSQELALIPFVVPQFTCLILSSSGLSCPSFVLRAGPLVAPNGLAPLTIPFLPCHGSFLLFTWERGGKRYRFPYS